MTNETKRKHDRHDKSSQKLEKGKAKKKHKKAREKDEEPERKVKEAVEAVQRGAERRVPASLSAAAVSHSAAVARRPGSVSASPAFPAPQEPRKVCPAVDQTPPAALRSPSSRRRRPPPPLSPPPRGPRRHRHCLPPTYRLPRGGSRTIRRLSRIAALRATPRGRDRFRVHGRRLEKLC